MPSGTVIPKETLFWQSEALSAAGICSLTYNYKKLMDVILALHKVYMNVISYI